MTYVCTSHNTNVWVWIDIHSHCMDSLFCIAQLTSRPKMQSQLQPVLPYTMAFIDLELTAVHKVGRYNEYKSHMVVLIIDHAVIQY